jgi:murein L,D-transpeptidase YcbB/YkuD
MSHARRGWLPLTLALLLVLPSAIAGTSLRDEAERLRDGESAVVADTPLYSGRLLSEFYAERDHRNAWDEGRARALLALADASRQDGFDPEDFHAAAIRGLLQRGDLVSAEETVRTRADILLSDALLRYLHHLQYGKYNPKHINRGQNFVTPADAEDLKAEMETAVAADDLAAAVAGMLPEAPFYDNLKRGYQRYLAIADRGGWQDIPGGVNLTRGMRDPRVALIREHLAVTDGFQGASGIDPHLYDEALAEAVKGFQARSGLSPDGVVGPNTLRALNHPLDDRLASIRANLERMRWLYHELPPDYVFVDVAAFQLEVVRDHEPVWRTRTVIGTVEDQTPMFRDEMEHLVFNPTWSVPRSIQKKMGRVSGKYEVIDRRTGRRVSVSDVSNTSRYRVVQPAGPGNALGRVKFMFPNGHAIYLHDTPSRHLFARSSRAYRHGCVRVKDPLTLARYILDQPNWDDAQINAVVKRGRTRYVHLDDHLQVLLYYLTALADDEGRVGFRRDVYNRDDLLEEQLLTGGKYAEADDH